MKISHKLIGSFIGVSLLTGVVGAVAIAQSQKIAETLAISEAEDVAQVISTALLNNLRYSQESGLFKSSDQLRNNVKLLHEQQKRDIEVVDLEKKILADAVS